MFGASNVSMFSCLEKEFRRFPWCLSLSEDGAEGLITFKTFDEFKSQISFYFIMVSPADTIRLCWCLLWVSKGCETSSFFVLAQISFQRDVHKWMCLFSVWISDGFSFSFWPLPPPFHYLSHTHIDALSSCHRDSSGSCQISHSGVTQQQGFTSHHIPHIDVDVRART